MPGYIYGVRGRNLYVNLFAANKATIQVDGKNVTLEQTTAYPWDGDIAIRVIQNKAKTFRMLVRIPGWVQNQVVPSDLYHFDNDVVSGYHVTVNGQPVSGELEKGYLTINRSWKKGDVVRIHFDMPVRTVAANQRVSDDQGSVAVERGPLVYCAEWADNVGINPHHLLIPNKPQFDIQPAYSIVNTEGNGKPFSVTAITTMAQEINVNADGRLSVRDANICLIPYYAWNHRGAGRMDVWLANSLKGFEVTSEMQ